MGKERRQCTGSTCCPALIETGLTALTAPFGQGGAITAVRLFMVDDWENIALRMLVVAQLQHVLYSILPTMLRLDRNFDDDDEDQHAAL
ncbi:hypothetical protein NM688_g6424 [Phlebia brevispora]|uniref:Uncharacterized protein n=1 Tax=Phlebia brevispora TaxID=194682 RepID=A0ACC1SG51_9APHY|nr:hypothetical protein NM688_g6424 [Phlebia brevispora]